jgi:pyrimidine operon attenuation protein / uracil phosphoribosyltransferase
LPTEWGPTDVQQALQRLATSIAQSTTDRPWALVGIRKGGVELADRLQQCVVSPRRAARGNVDVTLYRDDLYTGLEKPVLGDTDLPFSVDGCDIVLVDDVLYTGRTVRAAMDEILDYGRPARIRLAVLVDRGHRELPIAADHVGLRLDTAQADRVEVVLGAKNRTEEDRIWLKRR